MVYGRQLGADVSKFSEVTDFQRTFGTQKQSLKPPYFFANNANAAIRRDLWEQHPFDEKLPGLEDAGWAKDWMLRGYRVVYEPSAAVFHIHEETWPQIRRRYYREAVAARYLGLKHPRNVVLETFRETSRCLGDIVLAARGHVLREKAGEIIQFRTSKLRGMITGLLDGSLMTDLATRETYLFDRSCKAVVIHGPRRASLDDIEIPVVKPGDVLIKVAYEGICATDLEILSGTLGYYKQGLATYPIIPGHEFSGRVVKVGANAIGVLSGDGVVVECIQSCGRCSQCVKSNWTGCNERQEVGVIGCNGGYAQYIAVPARFVHKLPEGLDLRKACLCEPLAVVFKGLRRLGGLLDSSASRTCCVVGAGPIGHLCARVLSMRGHRVTAFDRNPKRLSYFDGTPIETSSDPSQLSRFEVLVEATGDAEALDMMLQLSVAGSTLLLLGLPYAHKEFSFESIVAYDKTVVGSVGSSAADFEEAIQCLQKLSLDRFIENTVPLDQFTTGWDQARRHLHLKVLIELDSKL